MADKIDEALDLGAALPTVTIIEPERGHSLPTTIEDDHEFARRNIRDLIDSGKESLEQIQQIALSAESPRAFEVVATLLDKLVVANEKLVDLSERGRAKDAAANGQGGDKVVNNTQNVVIIGTTDDMLKAVRKARGERDEEDFLQR